MGAMLYKDIKNALAYCIVDDYYILSFVKQVIRMTIGKFGGIFKLFASFSTSLKSSYVGASR